MHRSRSFPTLLLRFAAIGLVSACASAAENPPPEKTAVPGKPLIRLPKEKTPIKKWMKDSEWESRRDDPSRLEVADGWLHLVSERDSIMIGTKSGFPIDPREWPRLRMKIRVDKNPEGADVSKTSGDDAAFRLYVGFDRGGGLISPPNTIAYTWTDGMTEGAFIESPHFKQLRYASIGSGVTTDSKAKKEGDKKAEAKEREGKEGEEPGWVVVERNLVEDYQRAFPADKKGVPAVTGIVLKTDSNNTQTSAEAWVSVIELLPPKKD